MNKKANEPKVSTQKLKELEAELKSLKEENEKYKNYIAIKNGGDPDNLNSNNDGNDKKGNIHPNNQKLQKPQHISESEKEEIVKNKDIIAKNKLEQEQLNKQIDYLKTQIEDVNAQIANNQNSIDNIRRLLDEYFKSNENKNKDVENNEEENKEGENKEEVAKEENKENGKKEEKNEEENKQEENNEKN